MRVGAVIPPDGNDAGVVRAFGQTHKAPPVLQEIVHQLFGGISRKLP
jgi:hypothetical protein